MKNKFFFGLAIILVLVVVLVISKSFRKTPPPISSKNEPCKNNVYQIHTKLQSGEMGTVNISDNHCEHPFAGDLGFTVNEKGFISDFRGVESLVWTRDQKLSVNDQITKVFRQLNPYPYCQVEDGTVVSKNESDIQTSDLKRYFMKNLRESTDGSDKYNFSKNKCSYFHDSINRDEFFYETNGLLVFTYQSSDYYLDSIKFIPDQK